MATGNEELPCDTCKDNTNASVLCTECRELYCDRCLLFHKTFKVTKDHLIVNIVQTENKTEYAPSECDTCYETGQQKVTASVFCLDCREMYCDTCKQPHMSFKATKNHKLHRIMKSELVVQTVPGDSVNLSSDFEGFTKSALDVQTVPGDSVNLSSDFEGFTIATDKDIAGAQAPVLPFKDDKQPLSKQLNRKDMDKISAKVVKTFNGKAASDQKDCSFRGIICLMDGRILLQDANNITLKMFSHSFELMYTEPVNVTCLSMTKVSEQEIAVVGEKTVYFYNVTRDKFVLLDKTFKLDADAFGISFNGDIFALSCNTLNNEDPFIKICSKDGQELHRITSFKRAPSNIINLDSKNDSLYTKSEGSKFTCLSHQGQLKWELDFAGYGVVELYNCLLVTCYTKFCVFLCSKDGTYMKKIIEDTKMLDRPEYLSHNPHIQQLFVTCANNDITVLQLSF